MSEIKTAIYDELKAELKAELSKPKAPAQAKADDWCRGEWYKAVFDTANPSKREKACNLLINKYQQPEFTGKAMTQGTDTAGGYMVPDIWSRDLIAVERDGGFLSLFNPLVVNQAESVKIPVLDQTVTPSGGSSAYYGGYAFAVTSEANTSSETKPAFKQVSLSPVKFQAYTEISNELLQNSPIAVDSLITNQGRAAAAACMEYNILNGSDFTAIIGHAAVSNVPRTTASHAKSLADYAKMYSRLADKRGAFWVVNPLVMEDLLQLQDGSSRVVWYPNSQGAGDAPNMKLFGLPIFESEAAPALGSQGDVSLIQPKGYCIAVNQQVTVGVSEHYAFGKDAVAIKITFRAAGKPLLTDGIKMAGATSSKLYFAVTLDDLTS